MMSSSKYFSSLFVIFDIKYLIRWELSRIFQSLIFLFSRWCFHAI